MYGRDVEVGSCGGSGNFGGGGGVTVAGTMPIGDLGGGGGGDSFEAVVMGVTGMGRWPWLTFPELSWWRVSLLLMVVERRVAMSCPIQLVALSLSSLDPRWRLKLWSWGQWWPCCCPPELIGAPLSRQGRGQVSCRLKEGGYRCEGARPWQLPPWCHLTCK